MTNDRRLERVLNFNIAGMQEGARVGVRRAAAFLGMSERFLEGEFPKSLTLGRSIKRQFLADPYPDEAVPELREAWRAWIIGNALRELDQFLSLFLDHAFDVVEQAKLVSGERPPNHQWKRLDRYTNSADKHRRVLQGADRFVHPHDEDHACLVSLSIARNCLSHDLGMVTPRRATDGTLIVKWLGLRTIIEQGGRETILDEVEMPFKVDPEGPQPRIMARVDLMERHFAVYDHIRFTPDELLSICQFYNMVIDRVALAIAEYAQDSGVEFSNAPPPAAEAPPEQE